MALEIGPYDLGTGLILAPMAGVTDRPFRHLCRAHGADYAVSEMISSKPELWNTRKSLLRTDHRGEPTPIGVQIAGSEPDQMADAAQHVVRSGAQIVDINFGCPAKKVCRKAAGSALLENPQLVERIVHSVVNAVHTPVTVKIRLGPAPDNINAVDIAQRVQRAGAQAIAIHGRTRSQKFAGTACYEPIAWVKQTVDIPVIANGDIDCPKQARRVLEQTGADGLMLGRGAQGNPWLFHAIRQYLETGKPTKEPTMPQVLDAMLSHLAGMQALYGNEQGARTFRKHIKWYLGRFPACGELVSALLQMKDTLEQRRHILRFLDMGVAA